MLELRINGITVPLFPDTNLQRVYENRLFEHSYEDADFTIPIEVPLSDQARMALDFGDHLAVRNAALKLPAALWVDGVFITKCTAIVLAISTTEKTIRLSLAGAYGTFSGFLGRKKVNELALGGIRVSGAKRTFTQVIADTADYKIRYVAATLYGLMNSTRINPSLFDFCFPTQMDTAFAMDDFTGYSNFQHTVADIFNATDPVTGDYIDATAMMLRVYGVPHQSTWRNVLYGNQWFSSPQFYLHYVLRQCFEDFGFSVSGNILSDAAFQKIYLSNNYAIDRCSITSEIVGMKHIYTVSSEATEIDARNHVPDMAVVDFLKHVAQKFNLQYDIDIAGKHVDILSANGILDSSVMMDIDPIAGAGYEITLEKTDYQNGYLLKYDMPDERAELVGGASLVNDLYSNYLLLSSVETMEANTPTLVTGTLYCYVLATNTWYAWSETRWEPATLNLLPVESNLGAKSVQTIETKCAPGKLEIKTFVCLYGTDAYMRRSVFPTSKTGVQGRRLLLFGYRTYADWLGSFPTRAEPYLQDFISEQQPPLRILNYLGVQQDGTFSGNPVYTPQGSVTAYSSKGVAVANIYNLPWTGPVASTYSYARWWQRWADRLKASATVDVEVVMDIATYLECNFAGMKLAYQQQHWLVKKAEVVMPFPNISKLSLVRI